MSGANGNEVSTGRVRSIGTPAVRTESLWKVYEHDGIRVEAVRDVTLTIEQGEFVVLAGPSGFGKTTLLNMVGGLTRPSEGGIWIDGIDVTSLSERDLARLRLERLGFVFQAYNLIPVLSAFENVEFPLLLLKRPASAVTSSTKSTYWAPGVKLFKVKMPTLGSAAEIAASIAVAASSDAPAGILPARSP